MSQKYLIRQKFRVLVKMRDMFGFFFGVCVCANHIYSLALRTKHCSLNDSLYKGAFDSSPSQITQIVQFYIILRLHKHGTP